MTMKNATVRQLKAFAAVARLSSFSRAAEVLHLSQPAISTQIRKLELHAGMPLFEQIGKKIYLTFPGEELLRISREIIRQFENAEHAMTQFKGIAAGRLNVAVTGAGDYFFPRLLIEFASRHPGVSLNFTVHNRAELLCRLEQNLTDLAVMVQAPPGGETINVPFAWHPYVIVAPPHHPLAEQKNIAVSRLAEHPFVLREKGSDAWHAMAEAGAGALQEITVAMEIQSTETVKHAVMAGMGISFLSAHTVSRELGARRLTLLDVEGFPVPSHWHVVHLKNKTLPPVARAFRDFLMSDGQDLIRQIVPLPAGLEPAWP